MEHTYSDMKQKNLVLQRIKEVFENPVQMMNGFLLRL